MALAACAAGPVAGSVRCDLDGTQQVFVPPGSFMMGTSADEAALVATEGAPEWVVRELASEQPRHLVTLSRGFWLDMHEVTHAQFEQFVAAGGYRRPELWSDAGKRWLARRQHPEHELAFAAELANGAAEMPRTHVTWFEADAYARWRGGRLPTEAEWEYAARGPQALVYPWGNTFDPARCHVVGASAPAAVATHPGGVSWCGAHDLAGNAMEWVQDWLAVDWYARSPAVDPIGPADGQRKVEKGGWWGSNPWVARAAYRHFEDPPEYQDAHIGFRIVTDLVQADALRGVVDR